MNIFVDTSALYALLDADDKNHERAKRAWLEWIYQPVRFISSNYILLESFALIQRRLGMEAVRGFQEGIVPILQVYWVTPELHTAALSTFLSADRRRLSMVDCTSFEIMRRLELTHAFAFDRHFSEQGFILQPQQP